METITIKITKKAYTLLPDLQKALETKTGLIGVTQIAAASKAIEDTLRQLKQEREQEPQ